MNTPLHPKLLDQEKFPPLDLLSIAIENAVESPESSFEDIAHIVESNPNISARLLNLANSDFYNYPIPVANVPDALSVIGLRNTRNLSIALTLTRQFEPSAGFPVPIEQFWRHNIAVGLCTRIIALECREANTERYFFAGLLHKISRPLIAQMFPSQAKDIFERTQNTGTHYQNAARASLGFEESEVGAAALHHWRFPENISTLVRHYNKPVLARHHVRGVSFVHIANFIVSALQLGYSGDRYVPDFSESAWGFAKFEDAKLTSVVEELLRQLDSVCHVFLDPL
ncbi:HDOD domain family [Verrucomicrobiia bacterium DG1235]|nr:HDOD domain family [Verrucomicrobiae bacterium DG1235]